jgi:hypothetical protein
VVEAGGQEHGDRVVASCSSCPSWDGESDEPATLARFATSRSKTPRTPVTTSTPSPPFDSYRKSTDGRLDAIEQRVVQIESGKSTASSSPDELWKLGSAAFEAARYNEGTDILRRLSQTYPTHERADDAIYFRGQPSSNLKD